MNSLFLDTNAVVYWMNPASEFHDDVDRLIGLALERRIALYLLTSQLNDVYYVLRRHYRSEPAARRAIDAASRLFDLQPLTEEIVAASIASEEPDYEDGLVRAAAEALSVDAIVSYDRTAFRTSTVPRLEAKDAQRLLEESPS